MITVIKDAPDNVVAFKATGHVDKEDYEIVVIPAVDELVKKYGKINFLLLIETPVKNFSLGAFLQDLGMGLKHFTKWHKMAIVTESQNVINFTDFFSYIAPGKAKGFIRDDLETAKAWVGLEDY